MRYNFLNQQICKIMLKQILPRFFFFLDNLQVELQTGKIFLGMHFNNIFNILKEFMSFHAIILLRIYPVLGKDLYMQKYLLHCCF